MRYACGLEYDGRDFSGWQIQPHAPSVQASVEAALSQVADHPVQTVCAGRTDAGVHACEQIIHFDSDAVRDERSWLMGGNANLRADVRLLWIRPVADDFHARFSAVSRSYRYMILNRSVPSALLRDRVLWVHRPLDLEPMRRAASYLIGEHDFSTFRALACQAKSPVRTVEVLDVVRRGEFVWLDMRANAFLHHMVRNIAGVLIAVGSGVQSPAWVQDILDRRDRTQGGVTAKPQGLYLTGVRYPNRFSLPAQGLLPNYG